MKLTPLNRRYYVGVGVLTLATLAIVVLVLLLSGVHYDVWTLLIVLFVILWPLGMVGRALKHAPREPPDESI